MQYRRLLLLTLGLSLTPWLVEAKSPLTAEELISMPRLTDPQLSSDGKWLAYTIYTADLKENNAPGDIWLMRLDGGQTLQLTHAAKSDFHPRFSPDSKSLAFISERSGSAQIWLTQQQWAEPKQITELSTDIDDFIWAADGKSLLFTTTLFRNCDDDACNKKQQEALDASKSQVRVITDSLYRHWNHWLDDKQSRLFRYELGSKKITPISPRRLSVPPIALSGAIDFDLSPDGREVVLTTNTAADLSRSTNNDIFTTDLYGRPLTKISPSLGNDNSPKYSPDGRYIAYLSQLTPGYESDRVRLLLQDRKSRNEIEVSQGLTNWVQEFVFSRDGKQIYFSVEERGQLPIYGYSIANKTLTKLIAGGVQGQLRPSADGRALLAVRSSLTQPAELVWLNLASGMAQPITQLHSQRLQNLDLGNVEEFEYKSSDGKAIHGFLVMPPNFKASNKYPLVLMIHGGPQGAWLNTWHSRWNAQLFSAPGYVTALINPRGSTGYGQDFVSAISKDWGGQCYEDLMRGVDYLLQSRSYLDAKALAAAGGSFGGYMATWIAGHTNRFKALISHAGPVDLFSMYGTTEEKWFPEWDLAGNPHDNPESYRRWSPMSYVKKMQTPLLILQGEQDFRVGVEQAMTLYTELKLRQVPTKMVLFPNEGHWIQKPKHAIAWWEQVHGWLKQYIRGR